MSMAAIQGNDREKIMIYEKQQVNNVAFRSQCRPTGFGLCR